MQQSLASVDGICSFSNSSSFLFRLDWNTDNATFEDFIDQLVGGDLLDGISDAELCTLNQPQITEIRSARPAPPQRGLSTPPPPTPA